MMVMVVITITVEIENLFLLSGDFYYFLRNGKALEKEARQKPSLSSVQGKRYPKKSLIFFFGIVSSESLFFVVLL